jgi:hypothetical protein
VNFKKQYTELKNDYEKGNIMNFIDEFTKDNSLDNLNYHYSLLKDRDNIKLFYFIRAAFKKRGKAGVDFLVEKIKTEKDEILKSEAIFILGSMRCYDIKNEVINLFLTANFFNTKDNCIAVLGWIGTSLEDIHFLSGIMNDISENSELRALAAAALRQIWFNNKTYTLQLLQAYKPVLEKNNDYVIDSTIIACIQDLLKKKFGITESQYGEISGNVEKSKIKAINAIDNYFNENTI